VTEKVGVDETIAIDDFALFQLQAGIEHGPVVDARVKFTALAARIG
jgi:hypothetical protein